VVVQGVRAVSPHLNDILFKFAFVEESMSGEVTAREKKGRWLESDFRVEPAQSVTLESEAPGQGNLGQGMLRGSAKR